MSKLFLYLTMTMVMLIWGFNVIAIKVIVEHFAPIMITAIRVLIAFFVLFTVLSFKREIRKLSRKETAFVAAAAFTGVFAHQLCVAFGLKYTTASNSGLILGLVPLVTSVLSVIMLGQRLSAFRIGGIFCGLLGVSVIVLSGEGHLQGMAVGDVIIFLAVVTQAFSFIYIKKASRTMDAKLITGTIQLIGGVMLFALSLFAEPNGWSSLMQAPAFAWVLVFASAILSTALGHMVYNTTIGRIGPGEAAIFTNMTPFFILVGSYFFLGEMIRLYQMVGFVFVVTGVMLGSGLLETLREQRKSISERLG